MSETNNDGDDAPIPAGDIRFYDNYEPPLDAGDYSISVQQTVKSVAGQPSLDQSIPETPLTQSFSVLAPRFALDPADIYSVFPPPASSGAFEENLPHIVFTKRNLPWERYLQDKNKATPWMALLLLSAEEIITPDTGVPNPGTIANPTRTGTYRSSQLLNPPAGTLGANLKPEFQDILDQVTALTLTGGGSGYTSAPQVTIDGAGGSGAAATAEIKDGAVVALNLTSGGSGYTADPQVTLSGGGGTGATATAQRGVLCRAIDITTGTFTKLTPRFTPANPVTEPSTLDELKYLAHCRQVHTGDKEILNLKDDGWFSVVIGNRFPGASASAGPVLSLTLQEGGTGYTSPPIVTISGNGGSGATAEAQISEDGVVVSLLLTGGGSGYTSAPQVSISGDGNGATAEAQIGSTWIAHLVSLEGFENYLSDAPVWPQDSGGTVKNVRLASLYSWSFNCMSELGDFADLMTNLTKGQKQGGAGLLLRLPTPAAQQAAGSAEAKAQQALGAGYAALRYETMVGDQTFAWYRGPFLPAPKPRFAAGGTLHTSSAAAMIYDQANGLFDESYAAAWQTGRLLALADSSFGAKLLQWRREGNRTVNLLLERTTSASAQALLATPAARLDAAAATGATPHGDNSDAVARLRGLLKPKLVSSSFMNYFQGDFSQQVAPHISTTPPKQAEEMRASVSEKQPRPNQVQAIQQMLTDPTVQQLLVELNSEAATADPDSPILYIVNWLANLCLLSGVPFVNLVPDARMLPRESLRFFFVDPNYLDALCAGALSIGLQSSRDTHFQALLGATVLDAVKAALPAVRAALAGTPPPPAPPPSATMAGLLLRSSVVSGWPGLEVRGYTSSDQSQPLTLLRMERVAPDVLLVIFPDVPLHVEISEPKEGLAFGHEDNAVVKLRWVTNDAHSIGSIIDGKSTTLTSQFYRSGDNQEPAPVLKVQEWQAFLLTQLQAAYQAQGQPANWGPAAFAIQMVRAPEELVVVSATSSQTS
jgi:hypothetical protein